ncbi:hypothetical protein C0995_009126 [Termitomyces sp. Mi166|nr:hypothetical protein C0995_009126 [Termitomyces sp. Mi166\
MGSTGNTAPLNSQQLAVAWIPQDQEFNLIGGLRLATALQDPGVPPSSEYGSAYGFPPFGMGNADPWAAPLPNWLPGGLPGRLPLSSRAPGGVLLDRPPDSGPSSRWGPAISAFPPHGGAGNHYYYYYHAGAPAWNNNNWGDPGDLHETLACEGWLDIQKPEPFSRCNPQKW